MRPAAKAGGGASAEPKGAAEFDRMSAVAAN